MIKSLEGLRGVAALMVALFHLKIGAEYIPLIKHGYLFVDLFFVLSGFVIAGAYTDRLRTTRDAATFMLRRFGRLFPLLVFATVLFVLAQNAITFAKIQLVARGMGAALTNPGELAYSWPTLWEAFTTLTFTHSLGLHDKLILNYASWSISVEFWAYVLFAALTMAVPARLRAPVLVGVAALMFAVTAWASLGGEHQCLTRGKCLGVAYDFGFPRCVFSFVMGALIWRYRGAGRRHERAVQVGALLAVAGLLVSIARAPAVAFAVPFVFAALIWSMAGDRGPVARALAGRVGVALGARSFSVYMLHPVLLLAFDQLTRRFTGAAAGVAIVVAYIGVLLLVSGWVYAWLEVPLRNYFNGLAARLDQRKAPTGAVTA